MIRTCFIACLCIVLLSACHKVPDHARYIPKDALVVVGLNTKEIGKKIAWNAIMGSKLLTDIQKNNTGGPVTDPEELGMELMNTSYVYVKQDKRFKDGTRITALVPLGNVGKWEAFVHKSFPQVAIQQQGKYKDAQLAEGMYAGWNDNLLIVMNTLDIPHSYVEATMGDHDTDTDGADTVVVAQPPAMDQAQLAAEMNKAFNITKENALTGNGHFTQLEEDGHDVTLWINYDVLMGQYMSEGNAMGITLSNSLWKDAALAAGFDFEKGKIAGDILYYVPEALKDAAQDLGGTNADKELLQRLPAQNLDMLMGWHISPKGVKSILEKTGVLGFINLALTGENLSTDYILEAFTGDMAVSLNDFAMTQKPKDTTSEEEPDSSAAHMSLSGDINYTYALKINKKENFNRLLQLAVSDGGLQNNGKNSYFLPTGNDTMLLAIEGNYCVMTNKTGNTTAFLQGAFKNEQKPAGAEVIYNNPFGIYFNAQGMMGALDPGISSSAKDSAILAESKKLLRDVYFKGGDYSSSAFRYQMAINFINKDENSLLQLMDFAMRMNKAASEPYTAAR